MERSKALKQTEEFAGAYGRYQTCKSSLVKKMNTTSVLGAGLMGIEMPEQAKKKKRGNSLVGAERLELPTFCV